MSITEKWFDRKFDFSYGVDEYESLIQRLSSSIPRLSDLVADVPVETLSITDKSDFNSTELEKLLRDFESERGKTLELLSSLLPDDLTKTSMHPRLSQPMRVIDLMYFVAEHDQHHFDTIARISDTPQVQERHSQTRLATSCSTS